MPHFSKIVVKVKASGTPYFLKLWLEVRKGMLPVEYFSPNNTFFVSVKFHGDHNTITKLG